MNNICYFCEKNYIDFIGNNIIKSCKSNSELEHCLMENMKKINV